MLGCHFFFYGIRFMFIVSFITFEVLLFPRMILRHPLLFNFVIDTYSTRISTLASHTLNFFMMKMTSMHFSDFTHVMLEFSHENLSFFGATQSYAV